MSYTIQKLTDIPDSSANRSELADFMEIQCLTNDEHLYSVTSCASVIGIAFDDELDDDQQERALSDYYAVLSDVEDRDKKSNGNYPFDTGEKTLSLKGTINPGVYEIYVFLLLATRMNMNTGKIQNGLDGTALFEKLCAVVLKSYFGDNAEYFVFGTGVKGGFEAKMNDMISRLKENLCIFKFPEGSSHSEKDGKVDIVLFIPFADSQKGIFTVFGQCKTGTNWRNHISSLNSANFMKKFLSGSFAFTPVNVFMVCESFFENWETYQVDSNGLLFDRSRIMEYIPNDIDASLLQDITNWNKAALEKLSKNK